MYHVNRVKEYLDQQHVPYQHIVHRPRTRRKKWLRKNTSRER